MYKVRRGPMGWIMFFLGMIVGSLVGVMAMCLVFYSRGPEIEANLARKCTPDLP